VDLDKGLNGFQMLVLKDRNRARENTQRILSGEMLGGIEYTAMRKDGSTFPVIIYTDAIIQDMRPVGIRGVLVDITELKRAEEQFRDAALRWQTTFDSTQDAICLFDPDQRIVQRNRTMQEIFSEKNLGELVGRHCWEIVHGTKEPIPGCPRGATSHLSAG